MAAVMGCLGCACAPEKEGLRSPPPAAPGESLTSIHGEWARAHPAALSDAKFRRLSSIALRTDEPACEEAYLNHQDDDRDDAGVDLTGLPAAFHAARTTEPIAREVVAGATAARIWRSLFGDDATPWRVLYQERECRCWNVAVGRWFRRAGTSDVVRLVTYEAETRAPMGPKETRVLEYEIAERAEDLTSFTHRSVVRCLDASFGDSFQVETMVKVTSAPGGAVYERRCGVCFLKRIPMFGVEGLMKRSAVALSRAAAASFLCLAREHLAAHPASAARCRARSELHLRWIRDAEAPAQRAPEVPAEGAGGAPTVVLAGSLRKSGRRSLVAHRRLCTLRSDGVLLYGREGAGEDGREKVLGSASVRGAAVDYKPELAEFKLTRENGNWWRFSATSESDALRWVAALRAAAAGDDRGARSPGDDPDEEPAPSGVHGVRRRYSSSATVADLPAAPASP